MVDYSNLITKSVFPAELIPIAIFFSNVISHALGLSILLIAVLATAQKLTALLILLPVYILLLGLFTLGMSWLVSSLNVFLRDTAQVLTIVLIFWFWFTPIMFTPDQLPAWLRPVAMWNPLADVVSAYRSCVLLNRWPSAAEFGELTVMSVAVFVLGGIFFRHSKRAFGDVL